MTSKDLQALSTSMSQMSQALMMAEQNGWTSKEQAIEIWQTLVQELGIEPEDVNDLMAAQPDPTEPDLIEQETGEVINEWLKERFNGSHNP